MTLLFDLTVECDLPKAIAAFEDLPIGDIHYFLFTGDALGIIAQCLSESSRGWQIDQPTLRDTEITIRSRIVGLTVRFTRATENHRIRCEIAAHGAMLREIRKKLT
jgi:hypothetical protein